MPIIHTSLNGFTSFITLSRLDLGLNQSDFVKNRVRMKNLWLFKDWALHLKCRFSTLGTFRGILSCLIKYSEPQSLKWWYSINKAGIGYCGKKLQCFTMDLLQRGDIREKFVNTWESVITKSRHFGGIDMQVWGNKMVIRNPSFQHNCW